MAIEGGAWGFFFFFSQHVFFFHWTIFFGRVFVGRAFEVESYPKKRIEKDILTKSSGIF